MSRVILSLVVLALYAGAVFGKGPDDFTFLEHLLGLDYIEELDNSTIEDWLPLLIGTVTCWSGMIPIGYFLLKKTEKKDVAPLNGEYDGWRDPEFEDELEKMFNEAVEDKKRYDSYVVYKRRKEKEQQQQGEETDEFADPI
ncbi:hypothetical protein L596_017244 [Steinernema carpocapsae]|uniref:Uncharacterized protein n=1 Tax=Steinernema carpocapsae TaxID=34508 RepID=A0A4U5N1S8_STECR|nr:hypothetical protein L596_017244 [Steinernema carpocapsae]